MSNAAPTQLQKIEALKTFLADNGVVTFRAGFFMPGEDGPDTSQLPLAAIMPKPMTVEQAGSGGGSSFEQDIEVQVVFPVDASGPYSETWGGWTVVWAFIDEVFAGTASIGRWAHAYGSGQFEVSITRVEEWTWLSAESTVALMVELTFRVKITVAPAANSNFPPAGSITEI